MVTKEKLYDTFGELIYVLAMADGVIQHEEVEVLEEIVRSHPNAEDIQWSFNYEKDHHNDPEQLYTNVIDICYENGPDPEYQFLIDILEKVAAASQGITAREEEVIHNFSHDLIVRFRADLEKLENQ